MSEAGKFQVMPPLSEGEYSALKEDIRENGVRVSVVKDADGNTIDGHHRERAWKELKSEGCDLPDYPRDVRTDLRTDEEKRDLAWCLNMQRRHLTREQKREVIDARLKETPKYSDNWLGEILGVDHKTVRSRRLSLEGTREIPRLERTVGKDGKERVRNIRNDYVDDADYKAQLELAKKRRMARDIIKGKHATPDEDTGEVSYYYGANTNEAIARRLGVTVGFVENERKELEERGNTLGESWGVLPGEPPPLVEDVREEESQARREKKNLKDEGYYKDLDGALDAIEKLARALQMHLLSDKPKRYISPEDAVKGYKDSHRYRGAMEVRTEGDYRDAERMSRSVAALLGIRGADVPEDIDLTPDQSLLLEELNNFDRLADWIRDFASLVRHEAQSEMEVIHKTEAAYRENKDQANREEQKARGTVVTPLAGRMKKGKKGG